MSSYKSLVESVLDPKGVSGDDTVYACPNCEDPVTGHHLYVNYKTGKFNCFKCNEFKGRSILYLLRKLKLDPDYNYDDLGESYDKRLDNVLQLEIKETAKKVVDYSRNIDILNKYYNYHTTDLSNYARWYLNSRGINDYFIETFKIKEGLNRYNENININGNIYKGRDYSGRVMVPSLFKSGLISFYLGRDYTGTKSNKYSNAPQELAYSSEDVWSLNLITTDDVVICEGVMTALSVNIACGCNIAVATYGKSIASKSNSDNESIYVTSQGEKLLNRKFKTYYVFYDADAKDEALATMKYLFDRGADVKYVEIPDYLVSKYGEKADAADMTKDEKLDCLRNARHYDRFMESGL